MASASPARTHWPSASVCLGLARGRRAWAGSSLCLHGSSGRVGTGVNDDRMLMWADEALTAMVALACMSVAWMRAGGMIVRASRVPLGVFVQCVLRSCVAA